MKSKFISCLVPTCHHRARDRYTSSTNNNSNTNSNKGTEHTQLIFLILFCCSFIIRYLSEKRAVCPFKCIHIIHIISLYLRLIQLNKMKRNEMKMEKKTTTTTALNIKRKNKLNKVKTQQQKMHTVLAFGHFPCISLANKSINTKKHIRKQMQYLTYYKFNLND